MGFRDRSLAAVLSMVFMACGGQGGVPSAAAPTSPAAVVTPDVPAATSGPTSEPDIPSISPAVPSAPTGTTAANLVDPCTLVTREAAAAALGAAVKAGAPNVGGTVAKCVYEAEQAGTGFLPDGVELSVETTFPTKEAFVATAEAVDDGEPLAGLGEAAFQDVDQAAGKARVSAFAGGKSVYVTLRRAGADTATLLEAAKLIAQQLLAGG